MQLFYCKEINQKLEISEEESRHIRKVLRKKNGEKINLTDGQGFLYVAELINVNKKMCEVKVVEKIQKDSHSYNLHIAIAPTKNIQRFEWFLEKATEIGINQITPIICDKSERKKLKLHRSNRIILSAMKQSLKFHLPKLNDPISFSDFISQKFQSNKFIAYCRCDQRMKLNKQSLDKDILVLIGPEGDFTDSEINDAMQSNFKTISLGINRLRTETAGVYVANAINLINS